jgi:hypothetical protein
MNRSRRVAAAVKANEIDLAGGERPNLALEIPDSQSFEAWEAMGRKLCASSQVVNWWIGDWWAAGTHRYGERAKKAAEGIFGREFQTLRNIASVTCAFETSRRRDVLSFSHHVEVAGLSPVEADALLDRAEQMNWSTRELRKEVMTVRSAAIEERKRDVIDIRPEREEEASEESLSSAEIIIELASALSRERELTRRESGWLETALYRAHGRDERVTEPWTAEEEVQLVTMLREGKRPPEISTITARSEYALWKRINLMGGVRKIVDNAPVQEWPLPRNKTESARECEEVG